MVQRSIDWPCEVATLYRDTNLGLQAAVTSAVDWFFEHVDAGIVLEDDCVPEPDFFPFAGDLLDRYRDEPRVMHVSGLNMRPQETFGADSYFFAAVGHIWGWATWRRAWQLFEPALPSWPEVRRRTGRGASPLHRALGHKFASARAGRKWTWARAWYYATVRHDGLAVIPASNLVRNVGFGPEATHTRGGRHPLRVAPGNGLDFPLRHPAALSTSPQYAQHLARYHRGSYGRRLSNTLYTFLDAAAGR